jgi:hypothetical protein
MAPLNSRVWRRYGQLRIYVSAGHQPVGWFDPRTSRFEISQAYRRDEFWAAVRAECERLLLDGQVTELALPAEAGAGTPQRPPADLLAGPAIAAPPAPVPGRGMRDQEVDDLARNAPGASASARARELRSEHPLRITAAALLGISTSAQSFAAGARGERAVGHQLSRWATRDGWHVLHAVPVGQRGADIDHVVIGPFGVVTVNTKTTGTAVWVGEYALTVGGKPVDYLEKSRHEASRAGRLLTRATGLDVPVQSAIVFLGARRVTVRRGGPADVAVLPSPRALRHWLGRQRPVLGPGQVDAIYQAARRRVSWQSR